MFGKGKDKDVVWNGLEELRPFLVPIESLKLDPQNARKHSERNLEIIKNSFAEFGQDQILVVKNDGTVQKGNGRLMAAKELGWTHLVAIKSGDKGARARIRGLVDNRSGDPEIGSEWDFPTLADLLAEIDAGEINLEAIGWNQEELEQIMTWDGGYGGFNKEDGTPGGGGGGSAPEGMTVVALHFVPEDLELFQEITDKVEVDYPSPVKGTILGLKVAEIFRKVKDEGIIG